MFFKKLLYLNSLLYLSYCHNPIQCYKSTTQNVIPQFKEPIGVSFISNILIVSI